MASEKIMNFVEEIKKLSVLELSELVDAIQEEFGVTAAVAAAPAAGAAGAAAEEKTEFDLRLSRKGLQRLTLRRSRQSLRLLALLLSSSNSEFAQIIKGLRNGVLFLLKKFIMSETVPPWAAEWFEFFTRLCRCAVWYA